MHILQRVVVLCVLAAAPAVAQRPDTLRPRTRADSLRADSIARARQDSIALMRELERAMAQPSPSTPAQAPAQGGPTNPRLLPDISAVGDFVGDLTGRRSTQEDGSRLGVREVEVALQAVVDPYLRGDIFIGLNDVEGVAIEQAYLTTTSLPDLELRLGRFFMPMGKQITTHRHDLHTVEYPWVIQRFFGPEGLKGTGVYASRVFAPFGFYQEIQVVAADRLGEAPEGLTTLEPVNKKISGLAYLGRFRNYLDLSQSSNLELSASAMTGRVEQPFLVVPSAGAGTTVEGTTNAVGARQSVFGGDFTFRWRPLQQGLYKSFILQAEVMRQVNERNVGVPTCADIELPPSECAAVQFAGPGRDFTGAYAFGRYQLTRRTFVGVRYDWVEEPLSDGNLTAGSGYLEWFPSEFSKFIVAFERFQPPGEDAMNRILLQASFALGPHKPHPF